MITYKKEHEAGDEILLAGSASRTILRMRTFTQSLYSWLADA